MNKVVLLSALMLIGTGVVIGSESREDSPAVMGGVIERGVGIRDRHRDEHVSGMQRVIAGQTHQLRCQQELIESYERLSRKTLRVLQGLEGQRGTAQGTTQLDTAAHLALDKIEGLLGVGSDDAGEVDIVGKLTRIIAQVKETEIGEMIMDIIPDILGNAPALLQSLASFLREGDDDKGHSEDSSPSSTIAQQLLGIDSWCGEYATWYLAAIMRAGQSTIRREVEPEYSEGMPLIVTMHMMYEQGESSMVRVEVWNRPLGYHNIQQWQYTDGSPQEKTEARHSDNSSYLYEGIDDLTWLVIRTYPETVWETISSGVAEFLEDEGENSDLPSLWLSSDWATGEDMESRKLWIENHMLQGPGEEQAIRAVLAKRISDETT
jgi:hypothetical protein